MNKKIISGLLMFLVLIVFLSLNIEASIYATIGMKGLSFASPEAAQAVQTVISASNPAGWVQGYVTQQVTGEVMQEITKQAPEAAKAIQQYNQVKGWIDQGAQITEELKLTSDGKFAGGSVTIGNQEQKVGSFISDKLKEEDVTASNMKMSTTGENEPVEFTSDKDGASLSACGNTYGNLKEGSTLSMGRACEVLEADITATKESTYVFGNIKYKVPEGGRIVKNKDGTVYMFVEAGQTVEVGELKVTLGGGGTKFDGSKITGKDFIIGDNKFSGEVTVVDKGYMLGKDTTVDSKVMTVTSEKGDVLFAKSCQDVSGFDNYVSPCGRTLSMQGSGFSTQLKEGRNFGLNIEKDDILKYDFKGGKVVLDKGEQIIFAEEEGAVSVTNGEFTTKYTKIDGITHTLMDPDSIGKSPDVDITTKYADLVTIDNSKTGVETCYVCPTDEITGASVAKVTAAGSVLEWCKSVVGLNTGETNEFIGPGKIELFEGETVIKSEVGPSFKLQDGSEIYQRRVITKDKSGVEHKYSISSDGSITEWSDEKLKWVDLENVIDPKTLKELGIPQTKMLGELTEQKAPKPTMLEIMEQRAGEIAEKRRNYALENKLCTENQYFVGPTAEGGAYMYLQGAPLKSGESAIKDAGLLVEIVRDSKGNVIRYDSIDNPQSFKPIGGGKVELIR